MEKAGKLHGQSKIHARGHFSLKFVGFFSL
jgi:hypothetical protein